MGSSPVIAEVSNKASAKERHEIVVRLCCDGHQGFGQVSHYVIWVNLMGAEDYVFAFGDFEDFAPDIISILFLEK